MAITAWVILILSGLGIIAVFLSKLPLALIVRPPGRGRILHAADGLVDYFWQKIKRLVHRMWQSVLEAKDIKPPTILTSQASRLKKVFRIRIKESEKEPSWLPEVAEHSVNVQPGPAAAAEPQHKTAEELYLETIKRDPNNKQAYEGLGRLYLQEKNYAEAVEIFEFLTKAEPNRDIYWSNLGISLYSTKQYRGASQAYEAALKINSKIPARWINLALCFEAIDEHQRALRAINKALELDLRNTNYLLLLADVYLKVSNRVRAEEVLTQILSLDPTNKQVREKLMKLKV